VGSAIPFVDTAIGIVSAVTGLINLFSAKPAKPPKQKIKATYLAQSSDPATKAILINDWNPHAKININLPSVKASQWKALTFEIKQPRSESTRNTGKGAYLNLSKSSVAETNSGATDLKTDFPLVVLENLDKNNGFGYYSYNFNNSDSAGYNFVSSANLRLFGQLPNPSKLLREDGTALNPILFPKQSRDGSNYVYKSEDDFDMRHDAASYSSFYDKDGKETGNGFYSRYYFNANSIIPNRMPADWSIEGNLREFTSNISLEFDSRTLGWYWQPVLKTAADKTEAFNPEKQSLDLERSKLWIKDRNTSTWHASSYRELDYVTKAYQDSLKANTFYISMINGEGSQELEKRRQRDQQLDLLDRIMPDLRTLDQSLVRDDRSRLHLLAQIKTVSSQKFRAEGKNRDGLLITFTSIDETDNETQKQLLLYKNDSGSVKAKVPLESATALMKLPEPGQSGFALQREPLLALASTPVVDIDQAQPWRSLGSGPSAQPWGNPPESSGLG